MQTIISPFCTHIKIHNYINWYANTHNDKTVNICVNKKKQKKTRYFIEFLMKGESYF